jgi:hypothetical protein
VSEDRRLLDGWEVLCAAFGFADEPVGIMLIAGLIHPLTEDDPVGKRPEASH